MKTKAHRKAQNHSQAAQPAVAEPAWRRQGPDRPRRKLRKNEAVAPGLSGKIRAAGQMRLPAIRLHLSLRHWVLVPLLAATILGLIQLSDNERFFVFAAEIRGNQRVAADEIYTASQIDGQNIFWIDPGEVNRRLMALNGVVAAQTHVRLPNQVVIDVQEQKPLVLWQVGNDTIWIGEDGRPVPPVGVPPPLHLSDSVGSAAEPGQAETRPDPRLRPKILAGLQVLHVQRPDLTEIYYGAQEGLYFRAVEGWTVYLGTGGDMATKLARLAAMQRKITSEPTPPQVVDLRLDGAAYYR